MTTLVFDKDLKEYQNIVVLYRDQKGKLHLGATSYYNGRGNGNDYLSVMYKDSLPENEGLMMGWNYLDENNSGRLFKEQNPNIAVEDFLYAHGLNRSWRSIPYQVAKSYPEMERMNQEMPLKNGEVKAYVMA